MGSHPCRIAIKSGGQGLVIGALLVAADHAVAQDQPEPIDGSALCRSVCALRALGESGFGESLAQEHDLQHVDRPIRDPFTERDLPPVAVSRERRTVLRAGRHAFAMPPRTLPRYEVASGPRRAGIAVTHQAFQLLRGFDGRTSYRSVVRRDAFGSR